MWYLIEDSPPPEYNPPPKYWLGGVNSIGRLIGRKNVHIRIKTSSVSRAHATVRVVPASYYTLSQRVPPHRRTTAVEVEDSSAYGTFVKYPPGHPSNRMGDSENYHRRLDKNVPSEVHEGALLAFGAPTAWWRVGWQNVLCYPSSLSKQHSDNLASVANASGLQVASDFTADITHFVVEQYRTASMKFLSALVRGMHIVTPAWTSSVQHKVQEACKLISEAPNNLVALAAAKLADELLFLPTFSEDDKAIFPLDILESTFTRDAKEKRAQVFKSLSFGFPREETRAKWASVLEGLGAIALLSDSPKAKKRGVIHVSVDKVPKRKRSRYSLENSKNKITEQSLIASILSGDGSHIVIRAQEPRTGKYSEETSDVDADEVTDVEEDDANLPKLRARRGADQENAEEESRKLSSKELNMNAGKVGGDGSRTLYRGGSRIGEGSEMDVSNEDANERAFFKVEPLGSSTLPKRSGVTSEHDVRPFRRRSLPRASKLPMKRARYTDDDEQFASRRVERSSHGSSRVGETDA